MEIQLLLWVCVYCMTTPLICFAYINIKVYPHLGEHKEEAGGQTIHRTFRHILSLPEGIIIESIQCNVNKQGMH